MKQNLVGFSFSNYLKSIVRELHNPATLQCFLPFFTGTTHCGNSYSFVSISYKQISWPLQDNSDNFLIILNDYSAQEGQRESTSQVPCLLYRCHICDCHQALMKLWVAYGKYVNAEPVKAFRSKKHSPETHFWVLKCGDHYAIYH